MTLKKHSAEGGTNGAAVTTGNSGGASGSAFAQVTTGAGGTINYTSSLSMHGSLALEFTQATAANLCHVAMDDTASANFSVRFYLRLTSLPSADAEFPLSLRTAADGNVARVQMRSTGVIRITNSAGTVIYTGTQVLATSTWYRIEVWGTGAGTATATFNYALYAGDSTSPLETTQLTNFSMSNGQIGRVRYGKGSSATLNAWQIDDIAQDLGSSTQIGPESDTEAPSVPTGLAVNSIGSTTAGISWNAATDNVGVTGYEVTVFGP